MTNKIHFNKRQFTTIMVVALIVLGAMYYYEEQNEQQQLQLDDLKDRVIEMQNKRLEENDEANDETGVEKNVETPDSNGDVNVVVVTPPPEQPATRPHELIPVSPIAISPPQFDSVHEHDKDKMDDPLTAPTQRPPRHQIPPSRIDQYFDIPTRGYPDNYQQLGVLVKDGEDGAGEQIVRLFGRQVYPGSHQYEYYTMVPSGLDRIKIPLDVNRNKELYDDDQVSIDHLGSNYKVKLYPKEGPRYNPYVF